MCFQTINVNQNKLQVIKIGTLHAHGSMQLNIQKLNECVLGLLRYKNKWCFLQLAPQLRLYVKIKGAS